MHPRVQRSTARPVSRPNDPDERQAERAAEVVGRGGSVASWSFSSVPPSAQVQRQEVLVEKTDEEKRKEAVEKTKEAVLETPQAKELKEKVLADPRVKTVTDAVTSTPGLIATGAAAAGGVAALAATGKALPFQPPEIPLDRITPGLSAKVTYEGPVNAPSFVGLSVTYKEQGPKGKKSPQSDRIAADIARLKAQQEMFKPQSQKAAEKQQEDELFQAWIKSQSGLPGLTIPLKGTPPKAEDAAKKEEEKTPVQPAPASASADLPAHADVDDALATPGRPLDLRARREMETHFGYDFSAVRVHDDARAAATAQSIDAAAFTVGTELVFAPGRYDPASLDGQRLLAHELAHVVQQGFERGGAGAIQRLGAGEYLSRVFGEGTFGDEELRTYLEGRDTGAIEDHFDSDNKARAIVRAWRNGGTEWVLTAKRKAVLIREMLSGAVYDDDEQMILELLLRSFNAELSYIFTVGNVAPKELDSALDGLEHDRLLAFFEQRFAGGTKAVLNGDIRPQGNAVPLGDDIERVEEGIAADLPEAMHQWTVPCLLGIFCTLAPDVIAGLRSVKVLRFIEMNVNRWTYDGKTWTKEQDHPPGFEHNEGAEKTVGLKARRDCGDVASTLKHEAVHTGQRPEGTHYEHEIGAYTEAERFAISYGLPGRPSFRRPGPRGGEEPDPTKIEAFVAAKYGRPEAGEPEDELIGHKSDGTAVIERPDGTTYERPPKKDDVYLEKKPELVHEEEIPPDSWKCPGSKP